MSFPNRVGLAAGLDKNGDSIDALAECGFGFVEIGTITPKPQPGNPRPRLYRLPEHRAIVNRMGFNNKGADYAAKRLHQATTSLVKGVNIGKNASTPAEQAADDYKYCMDRVYAWSDYIVINISSPNTPDLRGLQHDQASQKLFNSLAQHRQQLASQHARLVPLLVKVAPDLNASQLTQLVHNLNEAGLDGLVATNTTTSRPAEVANHPLAGEHGGLSGPPLQKMANHTLAEAARQLPDKALLVGVGGIDSRQTAKAAFAAGAQLIQLYTGFIYQGTDLVIDLAQTTPDKNQ